MALRRMTPHARLKETDEQHFDAELRAVSLVLVKFTGTWCAPCRALQPTLERLVNERVEVTVLSVDVDEQQAVAQRFGVRAVPTLIAFRQGRPIGQLVGNASRTAIDKLLGA